MKLLRLPIIPCDDLTINIAIYMTLHVCLASNVNSDF